MSRDKYAARAQRMHDIHVTLPRRREPLLVKLTRLTTLNSTAGLDDYHQTPIQNEGTTHII